MPAPKRDWAAILAGRMIRCVSCYGSIGRNRYDRGKPCTSCAGVGYVHRRVR